MLTELTAVAEPCQFLKEMLRTHLGAGVARSQSSPCGAKRKEAHWPIFKKKEVSRTEPTESIHTQSPV